MSDGNLKMVLKITRTLFLVLAILSAGQVLAFTGPGVGQTAGSGAGAISGATGKIGIGTTSPTENLTIVANASSSISLRPSNSLIGYGVVLSAIYQSSHSFSLTAYPNGIEYLGLYNTDLILQPANAGNVGIATTTPTQKLVVNGNVAATAFVGTLSGGIAAGNVSAGYFGSLQGGGNFTFPSSVSIGTSTIGGKLSVIGTGYSIIGDGDPGYGNSTTKLLLFTNSGTQTALKLWQAGIASAMIGNKAGDTNLYLSNTYGGDTDFGSSTKSIAINTSGNVGIGTTAPNAKLEVAINNGSSMDEALRLTALNNSSDIGTYIAFHDTAYSPDSARIGASREGAAQQSSLAFYTRFNNTTVNEKMRITGLGNVGIATTTPAYKLSVAGDINFTGGLYQNGVAFTSGSGGSSVGWSRNTTSSYVYVTTSTDSVGIGTSTPDALLNVIGNSNTMGGIHVTAQNVTDAPWISFGVNGLGSSYNNFGSITNSSGFRFKSMQNVSMIAGSGYSFNVLDPTAATTYLTVASGGNVGIGTATPTTAKLVIVPGSQPSIDAGSQRIINVAIPTSNNDAATKIYVDSAVIAGVTSSTGSGTANYVSKFTAASTLGNSSIYDNGTYVGVGTTSAGDKLQVSGNVFADAFNAVGSLSRYNSTGGVFFNGNAGSAYGTLGSYSNSGGTGRILAINPNGGNVGIATTTPGSPLVVIGNVQATTFSGGLSANNVSAGTFGTLQGNGAYTFPANLTVNGVFYAKAGDFSVDSDTSYAYLQSWNSKPLKINNSGNNVLFSGPGSVGIGTSGPTSLLHVYSISSTPQSITLENSGDVRMQDIVRNTQNALYFGVESSAGGGIATGALGGAGVVSSNSAKALQFATNATVNMTMLSGGNVGVGTATPGYKLDVQGGQVNASGGLCINGDCKTAWSQVSATSQWTTSGLNIYYNTGNVGIGTTSPGTKLVIDGVDNYTNGITIQNSTGYQNLITAFSDGVNPTTGSALQFKVANNATGGNAAVMTLKGSGNVGIGTTSPNGQISLNSQISPGTIPLTYSSNSLATFNSYYTYGSGAEVTYPRYLDIGVRGTPDGTNGGGRIRFLTNPVTSGANSVERMRIDENGNVGIGTASPSSPLVVVGNAQASTFSGGLSAGNVSAGTFGSLQGNGNFTFPSILSIGTNASGYSKINGGSWSEYWSTEAYPRVYLSRDGAASGIAAIQFGPGTSAVDSTVQRTVGAAGIALMGGNVGIGTTTPQSLLHLQSGAGVAGGMQFNVNGYPTSYGNRMYSVDSGSGGLLLRFQSQSNTTWYNALDIGNGQTALNPSLTTYYGTNLAVTSGNVGIGTTTPAAKLEVQGDGVKLRLSTASSPSTYYFDIQSNYSAADTVNFYGTGGSNILKWVYNINALSLQPNGGNVGISTTTPTTARLVIVPGSQPAIDVGNQKIINLATPTANNDAVNKTYVDSAVTSGIGGAVGPWTTLSSNIYNNNVGNVGVGTTTPTAYKLQVNGTFGAASGNIFSDDLGNFSATSFIDKASPSYYLQPSGTTSLKTAGSVIIGGSGTPGARLDVINNVNDAQILRVGTGSNYIGLGIDSTNTYWGASIFQNGTKRFTVESNGGILVGGTYQGNNAPADGALIQGKVAIATNDPGANTLYVNGATLINGTLNLNSNNITSVNKLTVTTVDPLYQIGDKKYSTYAASISGGVKEEYVGRGKLGRTNNLELTTDNADGYTYIIDLSKAEKGSDVWVWYRAVDFSEDNVDVFVTPYGSKASIWYEISGTKIIFHGDASASFSYRLIGKRHDWKNWPTFAKDQSEVPSFILK